MPKIQKKKKIEQFPKIFIYPDHLKKERTNKKDLSSPEVLVCLKNWVRVISNKFSRGLIYLFIFLSHGKIDDF